MAQFSVEHAKGIRDGRAAARSSRVATAEVDWHSLPPAVKAYRRGYARGIRDVNRVRSTA